MLGLITMTSLFFVFVLVKPDPVQITSESRSTSTGNYTLQWKSGNTGGGILERISITIYKPVNMLIKNKLLELLLKSFTRTHFEKEVLVFCLFNQ